LLETAPPADTVLLRLAFAERRGSRRGRAHRDAARYRLELPTAAMSAHAREAAFSRCTCSTTPSARCARPRELGRAARGIDARLVIDAAAGARNRRRARDRLARAIGHRTTRSREATIMLHRIVLALLLLAATGASAHEPSRSVLGLSVTDTDLSGRLDLSLRDLEEAVGLDTDGDGAITLGELEAREPAIVAYASPRLRLSSAATPCPLALTRTASARMAARRSPCSRSRAPASRRRSACASTTCSCSTSIRRTAPS
jgi:hypothetical protein